MDSVRIGNKSIRVEVAITPEEHASGLMYREATPMLFLFAKSAIRKFWMKQTPSDLDIVFCSRGRVVDIRRGTAYSEVEVGPNQPIDSVLEVPAGMARELNIKLGQQLNYSLSRKTIVKKISKQILC